MTNDAIPQRMLRLARRYNLFLLVGIVVVVSAMALGAWESQALGTAHDLEAQGATDTAAYLQATQVEDVLRIITPTWNFLGMGLLTFGIGMSIIVIMFNLTGAAKESVQAYMESFPESRIPIPRQPWYVRAFPKLFLIGLALLVFNFLFALSGGLAAAGLLGVNIAGLNSAAWGGFAEVLRTPQRPGFLSFIVLGIGLSLAAIVYNLRLQARMLPKVKDALIKGEPAEFDEPLAPGLPRFPFAVLFAGFFITLFASYPVGFLGAQAKASLAGGSGGPAMAQQLALTTGLFPVIAVTGIVTMLAGIVYWLLLIIQALRDQRGMLVRMGARLAGADPESLEQPLWPERVAGYLAGGGLLTLLLLFIPAALLVFLRWEALRLQASGGEALADIVFLKNLLGVLVPDMRFIGMALVMLAIGLTLGVIVSNLKGMGMALPGTMARILRPGEKDADTAGAPLDEGDVKVRALEAMERFPRKLFVPLLVGALIMMSTTLPLVLPVTAGMQLKQRAALIAGDAQAVGDIGLEIAVFSALREPWNFIGMGLVFFAIGKFFGTIIGFVQARRVMISDACNALVRNRGGPEPGPAAGAVS